MKTFGVVGWKKSGKTTLVVKLLPELIGRGFSVSTLKHTHHEVDIDQPGKDSYEHRRAGAREVMLASSSRWSLTHELKGEPEPDLDTLTKLMAPVDLLLIEGFKSLPHDKIEVCRPGRSEALLCRRDERIVALASPEPVAGVDVPVFAIDDVTGIADFIIERCVLSARKAHA